MYSTKSRKNSSIRFLTIILLYFSITSTIWMASINHIVNNNNDGYILIETLKTNPWALDGTRLLKYLWTECTKEQSVLQQSKINDNMNNYRINSLVTDCLKRKSLIALDRTLNANIIPLYDGIDLVRYVPDNSSGVNNSQRTMSTPLLSDALFDITDNSFVSEHNKSAYFDWKTQVISKLINVFRTHVVKINVENDLTTETSESRSIDENARRRRHRHMMPIFMFGTLAMAMILIPMGFKFLAVLGGKALLLAKMALLLASIQGLKRIATSNMNYGLYHLPYSPGWHDRHSRGEYLNTPPYIYETDALYDQRGQQPVDIPVAAIG